MMDIDDVIDQGKEDRFWQPTFPRAPLCKRCFKQLVAIEQDAVGDDVYEDYCPNCLTQVLIERDAEREEMVRDAYYDR